MSHVPSSQTDSDVYKTLLESTKAIPWRIEWQSMTFSYIGPQIETVLGWSQQSWVSVDDWVPLAIWLAGIVNWRAHLDWSSDGHSGVDVNLYVHSKDNNATIAQQFMGNHENTWIGNFTSSFLQLDLSSVSKKLNNDSNSVVPSQGSANHSTPTGQYEPGKVQRQVLPNPLKNGRRSLLSHLRFHD